MQAIRFHAQGGPGPLRLEPVARPICGSAANA